MDLYGIFDEAGYRVRAYSNNDDRASEWVVSFTRLGADGQEESPEPDRVESIPMSYRPVFGFDVDDVAVLEQRTSEVLAELAAADNEPPSP